MRKSDIFVRFVKAGFHLWPNAPPSRAYLAQRHRHLFHVEVRVEVRHDDREIEFHDLLEEAEDLFEIADDTMSCEMMARVLANRLMALHDQRIFAVTVSEDGECGATVSSGQ